MNTYINFYRKLSFYTNIDIQIGPRKGFLFRIKIYKFILSKLENVIYKLQRGIPLDDKNHDHELKGKYKGFRECHIQPDWLLIYLIEDDVLTLTLVDTGTHSDLFNL